MYVKRMRIKDSGGATQQEEVKRNHPLEDRPITLCKPLPHWHTRVTGGAVAKETKMLADEEYTCTVYCFCSSRIGHLSCCANHPFMLY